jgi:rhomboid family GlyGly-CTERM serine protease
MRRTLLIPLLALAAVAATFTAPVTMALDREALASGQLWRLWTGHLVHWNLSHLIWDGLTFGGLAWLLDRLAPRVLVPLLALGTPAISLCVLVAEPSIRLYGGLSGLDVALWVAVCLAVARHHRADRTTRVLGWLALAGGLLKVGFEITTGSTVFVDGTFVLVPSAHLSGAALGWLATELLHHGPAFSTQSAQQRLGPCQ